jgi:hypothetical protein
MFLLRWKPNVAQILQRLACAGEAFGVKKALGEPGENRNML